MKDIQTLTKHLKNANEEFNLRISMCTTDDIVPIYSKMLLAFQAALQFEKSTAHTVTEESDRNDFEQVMQKFSAELNNLKNSILILEEQIPHHNIGLTRIDYN